MAGKIGGNNLVNVLRNNKVNDILTFLKCRWFANVLYFSDDFGRDEGGSGKKDRRERHGGAALEDVGKAADVDFDDVESESDSDTEGEVGVWSASGVNSEAYKRRMAVWKNEIRGNE